MPIPIPSRSEVISGGDSVISGSAGDSNKPTVKKKKKRSKKTIIDNIPDIPAYDPDAHRVPYAVPYMDNPSRGRATAPEGTSACPIYVSDFEDSSEVAVKGGQSLYTDFAQKTLPVVAKSPESAFKDEGSSKAWSSPDEKKASKRKSRSELKKRISDLSSLNKSRSKSRSKSRDKKSAFGAEDPILERELEEITLDGQRSGLISGTPQKLAYDIENGTSKFWKKSKSKSKKETRKLLDKNDYDDDKEKSWLKGTLTKDKDSNPPAMRHRSAYKMIALFLIIFSIIIISIGLARKRISREILTEKQQLIQSILTRVTGEKTLTEPGTGQYRARNWMLFDDKVTNKASANPIDEEAIIQRFALACVYFATSGNDDDESSTWESSNDNWLKGPECGDDRHKPWFGIGCNEEGHVRALVLDEMGLTGTIPPEVGHLYKLENLILKNNPNLTGWIPTSLSHLAGLRQLGLYNNNLEGVLPDIFEHTKDLKFINLEHNKIHGSIPLEISHLKSLETLVLKHNNFEGIVPFKQLASTSIRYLGLSHNRFSSRIERAIQNVDTLEYLYLDNNELRGTVPREIGELSHLKAIDLGQNSLTGFFPGTIGNLDRLEYLSINNNKFRLNLPVRMGLLTNLRSLNTATNLFTGVLPDLSGMTELRSLHLFENDLSGSLPDSLERLEKLESLFLSSNRFRGTIPEGLGRGLTGLYLSDNYLEGPIPTHLCELESLEALFLDTNRLTGSIPPCFGGLDHLQQLYLFENKLSGTVPKSLKNMKQLADLGIESNDLVGTVPNEVCGVFEHRQVEMWADCSHSLQCSCCSVCCHDGTCE
eukprot:CAMPEP_0197179136 /NCGR_PEP_ID=MMETSP1423-20130617/4184_1 /TAXON_ID=476441 /ORGANISM="Pseudo-nitzschia heimii, Strain UNC1101" /LENGTH=820 /DNA_ID=CAMNT_0042629007 /DNA_START=257 /DNA_END=2719 /DNA_ORIENTATION=-